jgi:hypothetical protein
MNPGAADFLRARLAALYLLSLAGVYGMELALEPKVLGRPLEVAWPPLALAGAALAGAALQDTLASLADRQNRARLVFFGWAGSGLGLLLVLLGILSEGKGRQALALGTALLKGLQPVTLLLAGLGRGHLGTLVNALCLTVTASLGGGPAAAAAVTAHASILVFFFGVDYPARLFTEYESPGARTGPAFREAVFWALGMAAFLGGLFTLVPCRPYAPLARGPLAPAGGIPRQEILALGRELAGVGLVSVAGFFLLLRYWGSRRRDREIPLPVEKPSARHFAEPESHPPLPDLLGPAKGCRARIVRLYLRLLGELGRRGIVRRPSETPGEFGRRLGPPDQSRLLVEIFSRARYGSEDLSEADVQAAGSAAASILGHFRRRA